MYIMLHVNSFASSAGDCHPRYEPGDTRFQVKRHRISKCDDCGNVVPFAGKAHTYQLQWRANRFYILQWVSFSQSFNCLWILRISGFQVSPICQLVCMFTLGSFGPHGGSVSATARSKDMRTQKSHIFLVPSSSCSSWLSSACP